MRRLFHGRMITVDGHCRRMEDNYDKYAIMINDNTANPLLNKGRSSGNIGSHLEWVDNDKVVSVLLPIKDGKKYTISLTKEGYVLYGSLYDEDLILVGNLKQMADPNPIVYTATEDAYILILVAVNEDPRPVIAIGDCGIIITEE